MGVFTHFGRGLVAARISRRGRARIGEEVRAAGANTGKVRITFRTFRRVVVVASALVLLAAIAFAVEQRLDPAAARRQLTVRVGGKIVPVRLGSTLAEVAADLGLRPRSGNLLDVDGALLRRGAVPGELLLNGAKAAGAARLRDGDRIAVVDGRDRREPLSRQVVRDPAGIPSEPQFTLSRSPGTEVVVRGALSHKLVAVSFRPAHGPLHVDRAVALTFDDGPSPRYTPRVLAVLKRLHVRATFFVIGYLADEYPALVRGELRAGMAVGNHSYNHPEVPPFDRLPARLAEDEITLAAETLRRAGATPMLFRPPGGSFSPQLVRTVERLGERVVLWSVDPRDWQPGATSAQIAAAVLSAVRPGSIVDLHDGGGDRSATVAALPAIVKGIRHRHLRLVAITDS